MQRAAFQRRVIAAALVLLAMLAVVAFYRNTDAPPALCTDVMMDADRGAPVDLPSYLRANTGRAAILSLRHHFRYDADRVPQAVYIGMAAPFLEVHVNARNLTPQIDLERRDYRSSAPRLYLIPEDALRWGNNLLSLRVPLSDTLGPTILGPVCVGPAAQLQPVWLGNWWRQVVIPVICIALLVVLGLIALVLSSLYRGAPEWTHFMLAVALATLRPLYLVIGVMPGGPELWRTLSDLSLLFLIVVVHRLLLGFWRITAKRWAGIVMAALIGMQVAMRLADLDANRWLDLLFWLGTAGIAALLAIDVCLRARHAPRIERAALYWALGFAILCAVLEILGGRVSPMQGMRWISPLGVTVLMATIGFLLVRRVTMGARLLKQAARTLDVHLDGVLPVGRASSLTAWNRISEEVASEERERMLNAIDEGFGTRMLAVLARIRDEMPSSPLSGEIQRALLDLRLMIDAIDGASQTAGGALELLRQRMQSPLDAAGLRSQWLIDGVDRIQVTSRRRLAEVFRCVEELLSNVIQHAQASEVRIIARRDQGDLVLAVEDDGCGLVQPPRSGRGLRNLQARMRALGGSFSITPRADGPGTSAMLRVARI